MSTTRKNLFLWLRICCLVLAGAAFVGCGGAQMYPGTRIPQSEEHKRILEVVEGYRNALQQRNVDALVALADAAYGQPSKVKGVASTNFAGLKAYLAGLFAKAQPTGTVFFRYHEIKPVDCPFQPGAEEASICRRVTYRYVLQANVVGGESGDYEADAQMDLIRRRGGNWRILNGM